MATASVTVRVDEDTKRAAANIVEDFGSISPQSRARSTVRSYASSAFPSRLNIQRLISSLARQ